jgi:Domain of unknown function (DUF1877)
LPSLPPSRHSENPTRLRQIATSFTPLHGARPAGPTTRLDTCRKGEIIDNPEQLAQFLEAEYEFFQKNRRDITPYLYLDKSIEGIQYLLDAAGVPVDLAPMEMPGEPIDVGDPRSFQDYFGLDADLVKHIAENLRVNSFDVLAPHFDSEQMNRAGVYPESWGTTTTSTTCVRTTTIRRSFSSAPQLPTPRRSCRMAELLVRSRPPLAHARRVR